MVKKLLIKIGKKEEFHTLIRLSVTFLRRYEEYFAEIYQKTDEFLRKWVDIYLDPDAIFSNGTFTFRLKCVYEEV